MREEITRMRQRQGSDASARYASGGEAALAQVKPPKRWTLALRSLIGSAVLMSAVITAMGAEADPADPNHNVDANRVVEQLVFKIGRSSTEYITKWEQPVHVGLVIDHPTPPRVLAKFGEYLSAIQDVTHHEIAISENTNFLVIFSSGVDEAAEKSGNAMSQFFPDRQRYQNFIVRLKVARKTCGLQFLVKTDRSIGAFLLTVFIAPDNDPREVDQCMLRGLLNGMGMLEGWSPENVDLKLSESADTFSAFDKTVLSILYDPKIQAGIDKDTALPIVSDLLHRATHSNSR